MIKKLMAVMAVVVAVSLVGLFAVGTVFAEDPTPTPKSAPPWGGAWGRIHRGAGVVCDALSKLLGMTPQEIFAERAAGKTLSQIGQEKGLTDQQMIDAMVGAQKEAIEQAVEDGRMTQEQAQWMEQKAKAMAPFRLSNPFAPRGGDPEWRSQWREESRGEWRGGPRGRWRCGPAPTATPES